MQGRVNIVSSSANYRVNNSKLNQKTIKREEANCESRKSCQFFKY